MNKNSSVHGLEHFKPVGSDFFSSLMPSPLMISLFHSAILVLVSLSITPGLTADPVHVSLSRQSRGNVNALAEAYRMQAKYGRVNLNRAVQSSGPSKRNTPDISYPEPFINLGGGSALLAPVQIGTPPQSFPLILDTGSADFWVISVDCEGCSFRESLYNFRESSTFIEVANGPQVTIKYGPDEGVSGSIIGSDLVSMPGGTSEPFSGFEIENQKFLLADSPFFSFVGDISDPVQGVMGLALSGLSVIKSSSFLQSLTDKDRGLEIPGFSFWIQRSTDTQGPQQFGPGGVFTIGGANTSFFTGEIEFLDMPSTPGQDEPTLWVLNVAHVLVNGKNIPINTTGGAAIAAFDTGSKLIGAPAGTAAAIWKTVGGKELTDIEDLGVFEIPCSTQINVSISFGGRSWPIDPQDMIFTQEASNRTICTGAIIDIKSDIASIETGSLPGGPAWIFGDTFLKNVYSTFRLEPLSIGFAQLSDFALAGALNTQTVTLPPTSESTSTPKSKSEKKMVSNLALLTSLMCVAVMATL